MSDAFRKYRPLAPRPVLPDRQWPSRTIEYAPVWCSVDLRDGNQALAEPMGVDEKLRMFTELVRVGFKEIEIGFPSSNDTEFAFARTLIEGGYIPDDVTIQVLVQAREHLIRRTFEAIRGAKHVIVHMYNATAEPVRRIVFDRTPEQITELAVDGARLIRRMTDELLAEAAEGGISDYALSEAPPDGGAALGFDLPPEYEEVIFGGGDDDYDEEYEPEPVVVLEYDDDDYDGNAAQSDEDAEGYEGIFVRDGEIVEMTPEEAARLAEEQREMTARAEAILDNQQRLLESNRARLESIHAARVGEIPLSEEIIEDGRAFHTVPPPAPRPESYFERFTVRVPEESDEPEEEHFSFIPPVPRERPAFSDDDLESVLAEAKAARESAGEEKTLKPGKTLGSSIARAFARFSIGDDVGTVSAKVSGQAAGTVPEVVDEFFAKPADEVTDELIDELTDELADELSGVPAEDTVEEPAVETPDEPAVEPTEGPAVEPVNEPEDENIEKSAVEQTTEPEEEPAVEQAAELSAESATEDASEASEDSAPEAEVPEAEASADENAAEEISDEAPAEETADEIVISDNGARGVVPDIRFEYSPEFFSATEPDFVIGICSAVMEALGATAEKPVIINLPASVENCTPNIYADQIEYFCRSLPQRDAAVVSVHTHNDRGTGIAAAELALLAGAQRVEGTLFGNGERTGNCDIVTLALNMMTQGVDPGLDFSDLLRVRAVYERCTHMHVYERQPYSGELVFTAFSGSHQDAINKGLGWADSGRSKCWEVPYLPVCPADIGRQYEPIVRINSQSGKGGAAFVLQRQFGFILPKDMHPEFGMAVKRLADERQTELSADDVMELLRREYIDVDSPYVLVSRSISDAADDGDSVTTFTGVLDCLGERKGIEGIGNGPIDAFFDALGSAGITGFSFVSYHEHAIGSGSDAKAVAYIELRTPDNRDIFGVGIDPNINLASIKGVLCAVNRAFRSR